MSFFEGSKDITIRGGTFIAQRLESSQRAFDFLASKALPSAFHMADADVFHSTCLPNTRVKILEQLKSWANRKTMSNAFIMWLNGAAGGGKTAIARTIAQWCQAEGILLGEFFFSRADGARDRIGSLAATLAYRMATLTLLPAKDAITEAVAHDPHIFSASLAEQITRLVLEPFNREAPSGIVPHVIILDGSMSVCRMLNRTCSGSAYEDITSAQSRTTNSSL
ncbi:hypothetical protein CPB84DRAFT_1949255 [Gymnopilus junonius]|uniref:Nephrocystin 3-like N-terminal domain-containing protein n=1 Tax=Gymnopilus junonius TaxID=109634 RepID=A0A9P5NIG9_GYMJU|nr:hypothetical protein CPB84DRAFT_1949255 [Gymnopilus junonius]